MRRKKPLKLLFYINLIILCLLIGYKIYLNLFAAEFEVLHHEQVQQISKKLENKEGFSFAVVGNINNSIGIFERRIVPVLNKAGLDLVVSAGNAVSGGGEDKYRAVRGTLSKLDIPYLLTFGDNENEGFGSFRFYEHFGPYFFSFRAGESRLIFLDSTGKTSWQWQIRWLNDLLSRDNSASCFLFICHPPLHTDQDVPFKEQEDYLRPPEFRDALLSTVEKYEIDMVFSANLPVYSEQMLGNTHFITTGGAGGLVLNNETSFYHFVRVDVGKHGKASLLLKRLEVGQHPILKQIESLWLFIHSLFYVGYLNFILLISVLLLITIKLYNSVFVEKDYYPNYDIDPGPWLDKPLRVAMFTNNYLPFIGGVPLSIERLRTGLCGCGDQVLVVAPNYREQTEQEEHVLRVPSVLSMGKKGEFRITNIFLPRIYRKVKKFKPDIIHLHHPFWMGSLGLFVARRLKVPAVYTYHTRLEEYSHFVPLPGVLFRNLISHAMVKRFANKCDSIILPTYSTQEYLRIIGVTTPAFVQPTGIEYKRFRQVSDNEVRELKESLGIVDERVFVSVSRLSNEKNIDFMIDAINDLRKQTKVKFRFLMIGEGHERDRLQQRIESLGLEKEFILVGSVAPADMPKWYHLGDIFLFASKSETQGMVILEAMAAGLPVVAVRSSGIDDVVRNGFNGFKTPEKQDQWCKRIRRILEDDGLRKEMSENALKFAMDYSVERFTEELRQIYGFTLANFAEKQESERFSGDK
ncbi:MAG: glycosyltransferase [Desulfobacteraceae bacterium]|nr:glycosyltransferase [Desulfobacteraceae bacterium]